MTNVVSAKPPDRMSRVPPVTEVMSAKPKTVPLPPLCTVSVMEEPALKMTSLPALTVVLIDWPPA